MSGAGTIARAATLLSAGDEPSRLAGVHLLRDGDGDSALRAAALIPVLADPGSYVPHAARAALQTLGSAALPALVAGLRADGAAVRVGCAWALAAPQGDHAASVAAALAACANDQERDVRHAVAGALGRVGAPAELAEPVLIALRADSEHRVRGEALRSLGLLGVSSDAARAALLAGLDDGRHEVRRAAVEALRAVPSWNGLAARVQDALRDEPAPHLVNDLQVLLEELGGP